MIVEYGGKRHEFPDDFTDADIAAALQNDQPSVAADVAKSAGVGLAKGAIGLAGLPGDARALAASGVDWLGGKMGVSPETVSDFKSGVQRGVSLLPGLSAFARGPTSGEIQKGVEGVTGDFYRPQTVAGEYAQTAGEFAPAALTGGGAVRRIAQALVPAATSETAGQATKGTAAEPYARIAGALAGGGATAMVGRAPSGVPTKEELFKEAGRGYDAARATGLEIKPDALTSAVDRIKVALANNGIDETVADKTFKILDKAGTAPAGATVTYSNLENLRKTLGHAASSLDGTERKAAVMAKNAVDDLLENVKPSDVIRGDAAAANELSREARANSAAAHRAKELDKKEVRAELRASAANSGMNLGNTMRQRVADLLIKNKEIPGGYSPAELAQMERVVEGTKLGNTARYVGNVFGGGGGLGQALVGGGALGAAYGTGDPRFLAIPAIGVAGRMLHNRSTMNQVDKLNEMVRSRSPLAQRTMAAASPETVDPRLAAIIAALLEQSRGQAVDTRVPAPAY